MAEKKPEEAVRPDKAASDAPGESPVAEGNSAGGRAEREPLDDIGESIKDYRTALLRAQRKLQ
ncbi:MAG: hypothetical protein LBR22_00770 [Desulfovibrio sp.]|jgi:hypothetical protein|nr:hypothetical protein [Desulfovibrio sp.]